MKNIKDSLKLFRFNLGRIIVFEIILLVTFSAIVVPVFYFLLNSMIKLAGIKYLSRENVAQFFKMPTTWLGLIVMLTFFAFAILINVAGLSLNYDWANHTRKIGIVRMMGLSVRHSVRLFAPHNFLMFLYLLCYIPIMGVVVLGMALINVSLPGYVAHLISANIKTALLVLVSYLIFAVFNYIFVYALHIFVIRKCRFKEAFKESYRLIKSAPIYTVPGLLFITLFILGFVYGLHYLLTGPLLDFLLNIKVAGFLANFIFESLNAVLFIVFMTVGVPLLYSFICNSYYNKVPDDSGETSIDDYVETDRRKRIRKHFRIVAGLLAVAVILDTTFYVLIQTNVISLNADHMNKVTITAHRGSSGKAPENTLAAFEKAVEDGADVIELDVRQTSDGEIVVMHDENLKRVCGVNKKVGKLTYEELLEYNVDAGLGDKYPDEKIPTLRQAIELIDGRADMNIEIKTAKTDTDLPEKVAEIVKEYDLYDRCVVTSQTYAAIKTVKKQDERIETVYVMSIAIGEFYNLKYADAFSIKYTYITNEVVRNIHDKGKKVYAWTIDDDKTLEKMMMLDVDSIITNKPKRMRKNMYRNIYGDTLFKYINMHLESSY